MTKISDIEVFLKSGHDTVKLLDSENAIEIKPFEGELNENRLEHLGKVVDSVAEICKSLETLKSDVLKIVERKGSVEALKAKMNGIESKIVQAKETIRDELLKTMENEVLLAKELKYLGKKMEEWSKPLSANPVKFSKNSNSCKVNNTKDVANEFQKFLIESGGHTGGWLEQDHLLFLRERRKNKKRNKFIASVQNLLPDMSNEDIEEHENWYAKYEALRAAQRETIQKWKMQKQKSKECKEEHEKLEETKEIDKNKKTRNQVNIALRIKEWKKKQLEKKLEEIERKAKEKKQLQLEREKMLKMQQIKRQAVNEYKAEKLKKIQSASQEEKRLSPSDKLKNNILLQSFRLQDVKFIEKKKMIRLKLESKSASKIEKLRMAKCPFDFLLQRDPQRIFKPTLIWTQHCQPRDDNEKICKAFNVNTIPRLAIPEWRRELYFN